MNPVEKIKSKIEGTSFVFKKKNYRYNGCKAVNSKIMILTDSQTLQVDYDNPDEFLDQIEIIRIEENQIQLPAEAKPNETTVLEVNRAIKVEIISSNQRATRMADKMEEMFNRLSSGSPNDDLIKQATAMRDMSNSIVNLETLKFKMLNSL